MPEGATPKDGPSAGITMTLAMVSILTNRKVRSDIAMTGEITLRGRVLPIGGLKEKLLAALSHGIKEVLIPKGNEKDIAELPDIVKEGLIITPVKTMDEVLSKGTCVMQKKKKSTKPMGPKPQYTRKEPKGPRINSCKI